MKQRTKTVLNNCLAASPKSMKDLAKALDQQQVYTVLRQNAEGRLYGITFVDNQNKVVFNGSDLGKGYSAAALQSRLATVNDKTPSKEETNTGSSSGSLQKDNQHQKQQEKVMTPPSKSDSILDVLLSTKEQYDNVPGSLMKKKRKKKKRNNNNF